MPEIEIKDRNNELAELRQIIPNLKEAYGLDGLRAMLPKLLSDKEEGYLYFQNGDSESLLRFDFRNNNPFVWYDDKLHRPAAPGVRSIISRSIWEQSDQAEHLPAAIDPAEGFRIWHEANAVNHFKDLSRAELHKNQKGFFTGAEERITLVGEPEDFTLANSYKRLAAEPALTASFSAKPTEQSELNRESAPKSKGLKSSLMRGLGMFSHQKASEQEEKVEKNQTHNPPKIPQGKP